MKNFKLISIALLIIFTFSMNAFAQKNKTVNDDKAPKGYDAKLAKEIGADDYGMKQYVFVILKTGKVKIDDKKRVNELQKGHMENIGRLAKEGKLVLAGPFMDGGDNRGIYIFDVKTIEEAKELVKTDPAINAGYFDVEMIKYYGSAGLMKVNEIHKKVQKKSF